MYMSVAIDLNESSSNRMVPSRLSIFFKEKQFITSRRSELYGPTDFLANCGGLLGLFMGVSLLSIVEMVYYCTLRLCCNLRARKNRKRSMRHRVQPTITNSVSVDNAVNDDVVSGDVQHGTTDHLPTMMVDKPTFVE